MISAINFNESSELVLTEAVFTGGKETLKPIVDQFQVIKDLLDEQTKDHKESAKEAENAQKKAKMGETVGKVAIKRFNPDTFWRNTEWKKLEDIIQKMFGLRVCKINPWTEKYNPRTDVFESKELNAYIYRRTRYPVEGLITEKGFFDKSHSLDLDMYISLGLIKSFTASEIVAVMLHEFGHSIDPALCDIRYTGTNIMCKYITDRKGAINKEEQKLINDTKKNKISSEIIAGGIMAGIMFLPWLVMGAKSLVTAIIDKLRGKEKRQAIKLKKLQDAMHKDTIEFNRKEYSEAFADNFARMYGFGAEMATALKKLSKDVDKKISRIDKERQREDIIYNMTEAAIKDVHKTDVHRVKALIKEYYDDIKDPNTPAEVKKQLEADVKEVEAVLKEFMNDFSEFQNRVNKLISDELDKMSPPTEEEVKNESAEYMSEKTRHVKPVSGMTNDKVANKRKHEFATKMEKLSRKSSFEMKNVSPEDQAKIRKAMKKLFEETKLPSIRLNPGKQYKTENISGNFIKYISRTKFGGYPYWPKDMEWPKCTTDGKTVPLVCIAQLNLSELPDLPNFPSKGILQFFILNDDMYHVSGSEVQVIYHEKLIPVSEFKDKLLTEFPRTTLNDQRDITPENNLAYIYSMQGVWYPKATKGFNGMTYPDEEWSDKLLECLNDAFGTNHKSTEEFGINGLWAIAENYYDTEFGRHDGSRIGGNPYFTQSDIREKDDVLLLQIDSEDGIMWGDCGVANFFCQPETLRSLNFKNKVRFDWDCC